MKKLFKKLTSISIQDHFTYENFPSMVSPVGRSRRLCQPPRPQPSLSETAPNSHGREPPREESSLFPATLRERARGRGFSKSALRMELTRHVLTRRQVAAALSAAVTTTKPIGDRAQLAWARTSKRRVKPIPSYSSGEGVWGGGASLREAASPPEASHPP